MCVALATFVRFAGAETWDRCWLPSNYNEAYHAGSLGQTSKNRNSGRAQRVRLAFDRLGKHCSIAK